MTTLPARVLCVDDEASCRETTSMVLECMGCECEVAAGGREALEIFDADRHDLVLTDNRMPGMSGEQLAVQIRKRSPRTPIVFYTGWNVRDLSNADAVICKPASLMDIESTLAEVLRKHRGEAQG